MPYFLKRQYFFFAVSFEISNILNTNIHLLDTHPNKKFLRILQIYQKFYANS